MALVFHRRGDYPKKACLYNVYLDNGQKKVQVYSAIDGNKTVQSAIDRINETSTLIGRPQIQIQ